MLRISRIIAASSAMLCGVAVSATAQPTGRAYAGAALGAFRVSADAVDGSSGAGSILGGFGVTPWMDVEVDVAIPTSSFTRTHGGDALSLSFAGQGVSREEIERFGIWLRYDQRREVTASISTVAIFHPSRGAVRPGLIVGVTNQRVRDRTDYTPVRVGPAVDPSHPYASAHAEVSSRTLGALTIGANVAIRVSDCSRREDAMGMHERWSGEYEYDIDRLPLVPPMSNGNSHEAKVARLVRRQR